MQLIKVEIEFNSFHFIHNKTMFRFTAFPHKDDTILSSAMSPYIVDL